MSGIIVSCIALVLACSAVAKALHVQRVYAKRLEELQRKTLEAQRLVRQRGNLANDIAHEIKNPITAILCSAEALDLLIGETLDEAHRKSLHYIKEYGDNLLRLVSDFLDISRAEAGQIKARPEPLEVLPTIETIAGLLSSSAMKKNITLQIVPTEPHLMCVADQKHFKQIIFNLLHNAIKFTPANGEITFLIKSEFPAPFVKIEVKDNGIGIPEERLSCLFDPYVRDGIGEAPAEAGVGLGLALCKTLTDLSGGTLSVRSKPDVGTTFELTFPVYERAAEEREMVQQLVGGSEGTGEEKALQRPLVGQRFLVVDEDLGSREAVARLIEAWGGMVDKVSLAVDAVEAVTQRSYDAVMIDDCKDGVYGHELARLIKEDLRGTDTKVIVASKNPVTPDFARDSGADTCIEKPLNGKVLLQSLLRSGKYYVTH